MCDNNTISYYANVTKMETSTDVANKSSVNSTAAAIYGYSTLTVIVLIIVSNVFMITVILRHKEFHTPTNYCLLSLCLANIYGFLTLSMLTYSVFVIHLQYYLECVASVSLVFSQVLIGLFMLLLVAIEKYIMIVHPLRYNTIVTTRRMLGAIAVCWVYSNIIALLPIFGLNAKVVYIFPNLNETELQAATWTTQQCDPDHELTSSYIGLFFLGHLCPILLCLICLYSHIIMIAHKQARKIDAFENTVQENKVFSFRKYFKSLRTVIAILGFFIVTWVPVTVFQLIEYEWLQIDYIPLERSPQVPVVLRVSISGMAYLNSVYNPVVCVLLNRDMRHAAKRMLCPRCVNQTAD